MSYFKKPNYQTVALEGGEPRPLVSTELDDDCQQLRCVDRTHWGPRSLCSATSRT
eukprot:COSAG04_NODE_771_length_10436_cov_2.280546_3_plen_55_part_00